MMFWTLLSSHEPQLHTFKCMNFQSHIYKKYWIYTQPELLISYFYLPLELK